MSKTKSLNIFFLLCLIPSVFFHQGAMASIEKLTKLYICQELPSTCPVTNFIAAKQAREIIQYACGAQGQNVVIRPVLKNGEINSFQCLLRTGYQSLEIISSLEDLPTMLNHAN